MVRNLLKTAVRMLRRRPGYALINGAGLTIGLAATTLVVLFIRHELRYDRFYENADEVHRVLRDKRGNWWSTIPFPGYRASSRADQRRLPQALARELPVVEAATNFYVAPHGSNDAAYIERADQRFRESGLLYTTTGEAFFEVLPFSFLQGTPEEALAAPGTAVLTTPAAQRYFGRTEVVGERLTVHTDQGTHEVTVGGVIEDVPPTSHFDFEVALHVRRIPNWGAYTYFRTTEGADAAGLGPRIGSIMDEVRPARADDPLLASVLGGVRVQAMTDIHLGPRMLYDAKVHRDPRYLWAFGGIGLLILLIVGISYTNLAIALAGERRNEIGVRKAMGSGRWHLAGQFFAEAQVLTLACVPAALATLYAAVPAFNRVMQTDLPAHLLGRPALLGGVVGIAALVGSLAGSYPALVLSGKEAVALFQSSEGRSAFGSAFHAGRGRWSMRHVLMGVQFALLIGLGSLTWLVNSQLHYMQTKDLGYRAEGLVELSAVDSLDVYRQMRARLEGAPGVEAVGAGIAPGPGRFHVTYRAAGSERVRSDGEVLNVDPGWLEVLGVDPPADSGAGASAPRSRFLVNRRAVAALGHGRPVGQEVVIAPQSDAPERRTIDGVVDNFHLRPLYERVAPTFLHVRPEPREVRAMVVRLNPDRLQAGRRALQEAWSSVRPDVPFAPTFVADKLDRLYAEERRIGRIGVGLTGVALGLAALGLIGLSAYVVRRRRKEIGIRKALGARVVDVVAHLNRDVLWLLVAGLAVASPVAYLIARRWLETFAYRIDVSPWVFFGAGGAAMATAVVAATYQAWQAARVRPAEALRQE
jgi:putative ABC transport system permease protein